MHEAGERIPPPHQRREAVARPGSSAVRFGSESSWHPPVFNQERKMLPPSPTRGALPPSYESGFKSPKMEAHERAKVEMAEARKKPGIEDPELEAEKIEQVYFENSIRPPRGFSFKPVDEELYGLITTLHESEYAVRQDRLHRKVNYAQDFARERAETGRDPVVASLRKKVLEKAHELSGRRDEEVPVRTNYQNASEAISDIVRKLQTIRVLNALRGNTSDEGRVYYRAPAYVEFRDRQEAARWLSRSAGERFLNAALNGLDEKLANLLNPPFDDETTVEFRQNTSSSEGLAKVSQPDSFKKTPKNILRKDTETTQTELDLIIDLVFAGSEKNDQMT